MVIANATTLSPSTWVRRRIRSLQRRSWSAGRNRSATADLNCSQELILCLFSRNHWRADPASTPHMALSTSLSTALIQSLVTSTSRKKEKGLSPSSPRKVKRLRASSLHRSLYLRSPPPLGGAGGEPMLNAWAKAGPKVCVNADTRSLADNKPELCGTVGAGGGCRRGYGYCGYEES